MVTADKRVTHANSEERAAPLNVRMSKKTFIGLSRKYGHISYLIWLERGAEMGMNCCQNAGSAGVRTTAFN